MPYDPTTHNKILLQILKEIFTDTSIAAVLGFKGGTAAYLFYNLDRFSVDLDFDLLDQAKEEQVFLKVQQIVKKYGQIKDARKKRFNLFFLLSYEERQQNIKIEINRRQFGSQYELKTYLGISMLVMARQDMFAHKLLAMSERIGKANRDIYDIWFFLKNNWPINKKIVEQRASMSFNQVVQQSIDSLENFSARQVLAGMGELLSQKQKDWAREHLISDTIFLFKLMCLLK